MLARQHRGHGLRAIGAGVEDEEHGLAIAPVRPEGLPEARGEVGQAALERDELEPASPHAVLSGASATSSSVTTLRIRTMRSEPSLLNRQAHGDERGR